MLVVLEWEAGWDGVEDAEKDGGQEGQTYDDGGEVVLDCEFLEGGDLDDGHFCLFAVRGARLLWLGLGLRLRVVLW